MIVFNYCLDRFDYLIPLYLFILVLCFDLNFIKPLKFEIPLEYFIKFKAYQAQYFIKFQAHCIIQ